MPKKMAFATLPQAEQIAYFLWRIYFASVVLAASTSEARWPSQLSSEPMNRLIRISRHMVAAWRIADTQECHCSAH
jgi:hypothetical protein